MRREENAIIAKCAPVAVAQTEDKWISPHDREDKIKFVRFATERKKQQLSNQFSYAQNMHRCKTFCSTHAKHERVFKMRKAKVAWHFHFAIRQCRKKVGRRFWHTQHLLAEFTLMPGVRGQLPVTSLETMAHIGDWSDSAFVRLVTRVTAALIRERVVGS